MILLVWLLYSGIGAEAPFLQVCRALPLAILAGLLPLTLSGIGTRDAALIVLMTPVATEAQSLAVGLLYTVIVYWLPALCGATVLRRALTSK
jgi:glycosyltransferase 2 family protein